MIHGRDGGYGAHPVCHTIIPSLDFTHSTNLYQIHLHGHDFAILEQVANKTFSTDTVNLKYNNPPRRDVVLVPASGYIVIAFKTDNPGAWLVHCHIAFHISEGLGMQIMERQGAADAIWPHSGTSEGADAIREAERVCNNWKTWYFNTANWIDTSRPGKCKEKDAGLCFMDDSGV